MMAVACTNGKENPASESTTKDNTEKVTLNIRTSAVTRSTDTDWTDDGLSSLRVYVFNADKSVDAFAQAENASSLSVTCTPGSGKSIYALANFKPTGNISDEDDMLAETSSLEDNNKGAFVMSGKLQNETIVSSGSITIPLSRSAAKISIEKIANNLEEELYHGADLTINGIYVINAATGNYPLFSNTYSPESWANKSKYVASEYDKYLYDSVSKTVSNKGAHNTTHTFYVYPNETVSDANNGMWSPRKSRLVVEVSLLGETYYYPLTLNEVLPNTHYKFTSLSITRKGSLSPDEPVSTTDASFSVEITDWNETDMGDMEI